MADARSKKTVKPNYFSSHLISQKSQGEIEALNVVRFARMGKDDKSSGTAHMNDEGASFVPSYGRLLRSIPYVPNITTNIILQKHKRILDEPQRWVEILKDPVILHPVETVKPLSGGDLASRIPPEVAIERKRLVFEKLSLEDIIKNSGIKNSILLPPHEFDTLCDNCDRLTLERRGLYPLEMFDYETDYLSPADWLKLGKVKKNAPAYPIPVKAFLPRPLEEYNLLVEKNQISFNSRKDEIKFKSENRYVWTLALAESYNSKTNKWTLLIPKTSKRYQVARIYFQFLAEDPNYYAKRLKSALVNRQRMENAIKFDLIVNITLLSETREVTEKLKLRAREFVFNVLKPTKATKYLPEIEAEVRFDFNRIQVTYELKNFLHKYPEEFSIEEPDMKLSLMKTKDFFDRKKLQDIVPCEDYQFRRQLLKWNHIFYNLDSINAMGRVVSECLTLKSLCLFEFKMVDLSKITRDLNSHSHVDQSLFRTLPLNDFITAQYSKSKSTTNFLKVLWVDNISSAIRLTLKATGKGWLDVDMKSWDIYVNTKLSRFLLQVQYRMQDAIKCFLTSSILDYSDYVISPCEPILRYFEEYFDISKKAKKQVKKDVKSKKGDEEEEVEEEENEEEVDQNEDELSKETLVPKKVSKHQLQIKMAPSKTKSFEELEEFSVTTTELVTSTPNKDDDEHIDFVWGEKINESPFSAFIPPIFYLTLNISKDRGPYYSTAPEEFPKQLSQSFETILRKTDGVRRVDSYVMHQLVFPKLYLLTIDLVGELIIEKRNKILETYDRAIIPLKAYLKEYEEFVDIYCLNIPEYIKDLSQSNTIAHELKRIIIRMKDFKNYCRENIPQSIVIGPFYVNTETLRSSLVNKCNELVKNLLKSITDRLYDNTENIAEQYRLIMKKLSERPTSIEKLVEIRDFIATVPEIMAELEKQVRLLLLEYDVLDFFRLTILDAHCALRWEVYGFPYRIMQQIALTQDQEEKDIEEFKKAQANEAALIEKQVDKLKEDVDKFRVDYDASRVFDMERLMANTEKVFYNLEYSMDIIQKRQALFDLPELDLNEFYNAKKTFESYQFLWTSLANYIRLEDSTYNHPIVNLVIKEVRENADTVHENLLLVASEFERKPNFKAIIDEYLERMTAFVKTLSVLDIIRGPYWNAACWQEFVKRSGMDLKLVGALTFKTCLKKGIMLHIPLMKEISDRVKNETLLDEDKRRKKRRA